MNRRGDSGQILIETAVVLPLTLFLVYSIIQLSLLMVTAMVVNYAAYVGARSAIVHVRDGDYKRLANRAAKIVLGSLSISRAVLSNVTCVHSDRRMTVTVSYPMPWLVKTGWLPFQRIHGRCSLVPEF